MSVLTGEIPVPWPLVTAIIIILIITITTIIIVIIIIIITKQNSTKEKETCNCPVVSAKNCSGKPDVIDILLFIGHNKFTVHEVSDQFQCLAFFKMSRLATGFLLFLPRKIPTLLHCCSLGALERK